MEMRTPPTIQAESVTLELLHEGDISVTNSRTSVNDDLVVQFSLISSIHQDLSQFIRKKLQESFELKKYIVDKEIEWLEKFVELLTRGGANNHQGAAEELQLNDGERQQKLEFSQQRLQDLRFVVEAAEGQEQTAEKVFTSKLSQIRIVCPDNYVHRNTETFKLSTAAWNTIINGSMKLRKVQLICEKLEHVEEPGEIEFWVDEVKYLVNALDFEKMNVGIGFIIEFACWKNSQVIWNNAEFSNGYTELIDAIIAEQSMQQQVFDQVQQLSTSRQVERVDSQLIVMKMMAAMIIKINDMVFRGMYGEMLSEQMMRVVEHVEFRGEHWNLMVDVVEMIGPILDGELVKTFEKVVEVLETKRQRVPGSLNTRLTTSLTRFWKPSTPNSLAHLPVLTTTTKTRATVRNFTVVEHPTVAGIGEQCSSRGSQEEYAEMRRKMEEEFRMKEEELRKERERMEEEKRRQQETMERLQKDVQGMILSQQEANRRREEEERRKKEMEEEERQKKAIEEENRRREEEGRKRRQAIEEEARKNTEIEEEMRKKREEEAEERRRKKELKEEERKKEEEKRKRQEEKDLQEALEKSRRESEEENRKMAVEKRRKCTILGNTTIYLHTDPGRNYRQSYFDGKLIGLLFSGYWCSPCRDFVPILRTFYEQVEDQFEVLFISSDRNQQEMDFFMEHFHGNWFNLQLNSQLGQSLSQNLNVNSIPTLIIIRPDGQVISNDGRNEVINGGSPAALIGKWMREGGL